MKVSFIRGSVIKVGVRELLDDPDLPVRFSNRPRGISHKLSLE